MEQTLFALDSATAHTLRSFLLFRVALGYQQAGDAGFWHKVLGDHLGTLWGVAETDFPASPPQLERLFYELMPSLRDVFGVVLTPTKVDDGGHIWTAQFLPSAANDHYRKLAASFTELGDRSPSTIIALWRAINAERANSSLDFPPLAQDKSGDLDFLFEAMERSIKTIPHSIPPMYHPSMPQDETIEAHNRALKAHLEASGGLT